MGARSLAQPAPQATRAAAAAVDTTAVQVGLPGGDQGVGVPVLLGDWWRRSEVGRIISVPRAETVPDDGHGLRRIADGIGISLVWAVFDGIALDRAEPEITGV